MTLITKQNRTEQNRTEQNRTEQNRTEQNRTEQDRTGQNRTEVLYTDITGLVIFNNCWTMSINTVLYWSIQCSEKKLNFYFVNKREYNTIAM
jgi:hypothetical protein